LLSRDMISAKAIMMKAKNLFSRQGRGERRSSMTWQQSTFHGKKS